MRRSIEWKDGVGGGVKGRLGGEVDRLGRMVGAR